ncbi:unnamed protein product, partial [Rotaria sp. Silwood1]
MIIQQDPSRSQDFMIWTNISSRDKVTL